jgi:hypothetical protein
VTTPQLDLRRLQLIDTVNIINNLGTPTTASMALAVRGDAL